ncbi:MAG TPA: pyridoxamine 5'-phosphate oxidase family protein [Syntrophales bacterium]|nr:pyridoxamine 5'-phosphate oxidase family protein [Syntrophales bacterium]
MKTARDYFETKKGLGILATADKSGRVDLALYARPHVVDSETVVFVMTGRRTHENLKVNPYAAYLFKEEGKGYRGIRFYLTKIREETDPEKIEVYRRRTVHYPEPERAEKELYLVYFRVNEIRPLVGSGPEERETSGTVFFE